jgi:hypothetical protein
MQPSQRPSPMPAEQPAPLRTLPCCGPRRPRAVLPLAGANFVPGRRVCPGRASRVQRARIPCAPVRSHGAASVTGEMQRERASLIARS